MVKEAFFLRIYTDISCSRKVLKRCFLLVIKSCWSHNVNCDILITHTSTTKTWCSLATQTESLTSLSSFWDIELHISVNSWNIHTASVFLYEV